MRCARDRARDASAGRPTYLDVALAAGDAWTFTPPADHTVAWAMVYRGEARVAGESLVEELVGFEPSHEAITIEAVTAARVLFGSAAKHDHRLVLGSHPVHTSEAALARGTARIRAVGADLRRQGRL